MIDSLAHSAITFWVLALFIIVADSCVLLAEGTFSYTQTRSGLLRLRCRSHPFVILRRELLCSVVSYPAMAFGLCRVTECEGVSATALLRDCHGRRDLNILTICAAGSLTLTVLGPVLSLAVGNGYAFLIIWLCCYGLAGISLCKIWPRRRALHLKRGDITTIALELLFCPLLTANIWKKLAVVNVSTISKRSLVMRTDENAQMLLARMAENLAERGTVSASTEDRAADRG